MMVIGILAFTIFTISLLIGIVNLGIGLFRKKKNTSARKFFWIAIASFLVFLVTALVAPDENESADTKIEVAAEDEDDIEDDWEDTDDWETSIYDIHDTDQSETEKYDAVESIARDYAPSDADLKEFADDIITTYQSGTYLDLTENQQLVQIFKSSVLDRNGSGTLKDFAFDYLQVQKYVYRGAEEPDSQFVKENEYQMNKTLKLIK